MKIFDTPSQREPLPAGGFTFVELAVTIALVGVFGSIADTSCKLSRKRTEHQQPVLDITTIALALQRYADGDRGQLPSLAGFGLAGLCDPRGEPYQYLPLAAASLGDWCKDKNLHPLNTTFGDILRVSHGGFIGVASDG